jgi:hypothetical protein
MRTWLSRPNGRSGRRSGRRGSRAGDSLILGSKSLIRQKSSLVVMEQGIARNELRSLLESASGAPKQSKRAGNRRNSLMFSLLAGNSPRHNAKPRGRTWVVRARRTRCPGSAARFISAEQSHCILAEQSQRSDTRPSRVFWRNNFERKCQENQRPHLTEPRRAPPWRPSMCPVALHSPRGALYPAAARISRSAAALASAVISAPASMRAISSRRRSGSSSATRVATRLPLASASLVMR